jgi:hypothetical protein
VRFRKWKPFAEYPDELYCEGIHDDYEGIRILIRKDRKDSMRRIKFDHVFGYRVADESYKLKTIEALPDDGSIEGPFFILEESDYLEYFHEETLGIYRDMGIEHYCIYLCNDCIDVLSSYEPEAKDLSED